MEVALSSASGATTPRHVCSSPCDCDDVAGVVDAEPRCSSAAAATTVSCYGDTPPPSSPASQVDDAKPRIFLLQRHLHHHRHHQDHQSRPHGNPSSPRLAVSKPHQPQTRTRCSLDVASIVASNNALTFVDNR